MSRPKDILIVCFAMSSAVLAVIAWRQRVEIEQLKAVAAPGGTEPRNTLTLRHADKRSFALGHPRAGDETPRFRDKSGNSGRAEVAADPDERSVSTRSGRARALARLMENPEFVQALGRQRKAMLDARFGELFRRLNLPDDELAAFKHLLVEKENVALDVIAVNETSSDGRLGPDALRASVRLAQAQVEQAIHSSLGSERYEIYVEYQRTLAQRATVAQLEQRLSYTSAPLTAAQTDAMVRIMSANAPRPPVESTPAVSVVVQAGVPEAVPILPTSAATGRVTEEIVTHAQSVLSPSQVNALREIQAEQHAAIRTAELIREALPALGEIPGWAMLLLQ